MIEVNKIQCPECYSTSTITDYDRAELICNKCGLVLDDYLIDYNPEYTKIVKLNNNKKEGNCRQSFCNYYNLNLCTMIGQENRDSNGNKLPNSKRYKFYKLRKLDYKTKTSSMKEKRLIEALRNLNKMTSYLELPRNVRETAAYIYRKTEKKGLLKGRSIDGISASIIYASCKICNVPRSLYEISQVYKISETEIGRYYKILNKSIKFKIFPPSPHNFIGRFCDELNLDNKVMFKTSEILKYAELNGLTIGRNPVSIAAAAIYLASLVCGNCKTQKEVADVAGITDLGLRKIYKKLIYC